MSALQSKEIKSKCENQPKQVKNDEPYLQKAKNIAFESEKMLLNPKAESPPSLSNSAVVDQGEKEAGIVVCGIKI